MFRNSTGNTGSPVAAVTSSSNISVNIFNIIVILIVMLIIVFVTIWIINKIKNGSKKQKELTPQKYMQLNSKRDIPYTISSEELPVAAMGNDFTMSFWIYLAENYEQSANHKIIFYRGEQEGTSVTPFMLKPSCPIVAMDRDTNKMHIGVATTRVNDSMSIDEIFTMTNLSDKRYLVSSIEYVPLQRWVNVTIMIIDNVMRIYLDGDILSVASTSEIKGSPGIIASENDIIVGSSNQSMNVQGHFANFRYFNHSIPQTKVKGIYRAGPVKSSWLKYISLGNYGLRTPIYKID